MARRRFDHRADLVRLRDVAGECRRVMAGGAQPRDLLLQPRIAAEIVDRNLGAIPRQAFDRREPDAGGAAGDQGHLAR